ncbi:sigma-54-dependent Fis family transcriptional regulator, partial [bacterium]|nr:sigma-54-dependent Fis family transcriptional regulator [bacterium]
VLVFANCHIQDQQELEASLFGAGDSVPGSDKGKFSLANGGTLFLAEVGELPEVLQRRLLELLEQNTVTYHQGGEPVALNVRVLASTSRALETEVENGNFLKELYHLLSLFPIQVPTLQDHKEDIPELVRHFIGIHAPGLGMRIPKVQEDFLEAIKHTPWPGNVRELELFIERSLTWTRHEASPVFDRGLFDRLQGPEKSKGRPGSTICGIPTNHSLRDATTEFQRMFIRQVLKQSGSNLSKAAQTLGMDRGNFYRKVKKLLPEANSNGLLKGQAKEKSL